MQAARLATGRHVQSAHVAAARHAAGAAGHAHRHCRCLAASTRSDNGAVGGPVTQTLKYTRINDRERQLDDRERQLDDMQQAIHDVIEEEMHRELESFNQAVHDAFEQELDTAKLSVREAVTAALTEGTKIERKLNITANVNTLMAVMAVISLWRGVGGLLDILFEDSLEGYVACVVFGLSIITLIRVLKLPVVEGQNLGGF